MSNSARVGEIFQTTGAAFKKLGELTMQLQGAGSGTGGAKWSEQEIAMLHKAVNNFAADINVISETMKNKTVSQIKGALQKKAFEDAGINIQQIPQANTAPLPTQNKQKEIEISRTGSSMNMDTSEVEEHSSLKAPLVQNDDLPSSETIQKAPLTSVSNQHSAHLNPSGSGVLPVAAIDTSHPESSAVEEVLGSTSNVDVTLNMLNASENEVDVEGLGPTSDKVDLNSSA